MSEKAKEQKAQYQEASALLRAAIAQLDAIKQTMASGHSAQLDGAAQRAAQAVAAIKNAMQSGNVDPATLSTLAGEINLGGDASTPIADSGTGAAMAASMRLGGASFESHAAVDRLSDDFFRKHLFDADVARHTHGVDLEAFKRREAEDEKYIHGQLARHTAEGDLNASGRMQGYMLDANTHGAGDNPEFLKAWEELKGKTDNLRDSMRAAGKNTDEYDKHIRGDVVEFLKAKGLSDDQIGQALAKSDNPLDAVNPYLTSDNDGKKLAESLRVESTSEGPQKDPAAAITSRKDRPITIDIDSMSAKLAAAGLDACSTSGSSGHGLSVQKPARNNDIMVR
jgi:hypothetical protein